MALTSLQTRPVSPYLTPNSQKAPQKTISAQKNSNLQQGNIFKQLEKIQKYDKIQSHYSNNNKNMKKVVPSSKFRDIHDENIDIIENLKTENLEYKKTSQVLEKKVKNLRVFVLKIGSGIARARIKLDFDAKLGTFLG